jgi:hypothetical protein
MKKMFALTISLILIISILLPVASACEIPTEVTGSLMTILSEGNPQDAITLEKTIKVGDNWVDSYNGNPGDLLHFRIKLTYDADWDGDPSYPGETNGYKIYDITIVDILPDGMTYIGNSIPEIFSISSDNKIITWKNDTTLYDDQSISVEFDATVDHAGVFVNNVQVTATESCYVVQRNASAQATVVISDCIDCPPIKCRDIDNDGRQEFAIDQNNDSSDGYEIYQDPDGSSNEIKKIDGDEDGKIDHFIDIDKDGKPDKYWDPDDDILSIIYIIDVDYDGTLEWVYDSDDDFDRKPDKYYDPDDDQIHPYVVYELTINIIGNGTVEKDPNGILFLKDFVVQLNAIAESGWEFVNYSGDITSDNKTMSITMDADKTIIALFTNSSGELPTVKITKPESNSFYFFNMRLKSLENKTEIIGPITVKVKAESNKGIEKVEFYINGELKHTDNYAPYTWLWLFKPKGDEENFTISVVAYDKEGNNNTDSINVIRSQFTPIRDHKLLSLAIAGIGVTYLLKNRGEEPDETIPVEPDDGDAVDNDDSNNFPDNDTAEIEKNEPSSAIGGDEDGLFWYILSGLGVAIATSVALLYLRRKIYV